MNIIERARQLRAQIEQLAETLDDDVALDYVELFTSWAEDTAYEVDTRVRYEGVLYKCLQAHTSQSTWTPADAPSLWAQVLIPDPGVIPEWIQPDSTNPYMKGDVVMHNDKIWVSNIDNNTWEPGVYGWDEMVDENEPTEPTEPTDEPVEPTEPTDEPTETTNEWVQPDSTNPYMTGDIVVHNDKTWISTVDNNVWEPGVYGWDEVTE